MQHATEQQASAKEFEVVQKELFLSGIEDQVNGYMGAAYVRMITRPLDSLESDFLIRDIVKTYDGSVTVNVWLDHKGMCPIVAGSSGLHEFDVMPVSDYNTLTIPFEQIVTVIVMPAISASGRFNS